MTRWELLVRVDLSRPYVVEAKPEGFPWTRLERSEPFWRLIRVPLVGVEVDALLVQKPRPVGGAEFEARERTINPFLLFGLPREGVTDLPRDRFLAAVQ